MVKTSTLLPSKDRLRTAIATIAILTSTLAGCLPGYRAGHRPSGTEAKTYIGSMNRAQQAYQIEYNAFADMDEFDELGLGIPTETNNYIYSIELQDQHSAVQQIARSKDDNLNSYTGLVWLTEIQDSFPTLTLLCVSNFPSTEPVPKFATVSPETPLDQVDCPPGYTDVDKIQTRNPSWWERLFLY